MEHKIAFVFPGQGSQKVGMGQDWAEAYPEAREVFATADEVLGEPLSRLIWEGPEETLQLTRNTQPALLACSIAIHRVVTGAGLAPLAVAGHSLGEYSALVAAGALELTDALRLVRRRGELMQAAVPAGEGAMAALLGLETAAAEEVAAAAAGEQVCTVANLNAPGQTVIAGHREAVERATELARERGAKRAKVLPVSAPFHSPLMRPAREALAPELAATRFRDPRVPVVTNVDAAAVTGGEAARDALVRQVDAPVRWVESMHFLTGTYGVDTVLEIGPGTVLAGLGKRIVEGVTWVSIQTPQALAKFLQQE